MLAAAVATHPMRENATGDCRDRALRGDRALKVLHDRALIKQNLGQTIGEKMGRRRRIKKIRRGATVKAKYRSCHNYSDLKFSDGPF
jgi:hypothetical protein